MSLVTIKGGRELLNFGKFVKQLSKDTRCVNRFYEYR